MFIATNWPEYWWTTSKELIGTAGCVKVGGALSIADCNTCVIDFILYGLALLACAAEDFDIFNINKYLLGC